MGKKHIDSNNATAATKKFSIHVNESSLDKKPSAKVLTVKNSSAKKKKGSQVFDLNVSPTAERKRTAQYTPLHLTPQRYPQRKRQRQEPPRPPNFAANVLNIDGDMDDEEYSI